jgi:hypothetical protein
MKNNIVVVFSSHLSEEANQKFIKHISDTIGVKHQVLCYPNFNQFSLPQIYNDAIREHNNPDAIMVFCHNDITIKTRTWGRLLLNKFNNSDFQIIGVAGTTYLAENGVWWHDRKKMYGVVEHTDGYKTWVSEYAIPRPGITKPVILVDGVFIAADCNAIEHQWDEEFKGFHLYDLSFCVPNYLDGCNIGVTTDIRILHQSVGMVNEQWDANRKQFVEKYKEELPIVYTETVKNEEDVLVNVLTRTHDREKYFKVCRESILNQTYKNINHIVGSDVECPYYSNAIKLSPKEVLYPKPEIGTYPAPWNLHLNELNSHVKDGWVMYLDDDDMFTHQNAVRFIVDNIENDDQILFWRVNINNGWIVPGDDVFGKKIMPGNISGIGMMFHSKHLPVDWGSWSYGDFRVITQLLVKKLKPRWVDLVLTQTQGRPNNGRPPVD